MAHTLVPVSGEIVGRVLGVRTARPMIEQVDYSAAASSVLRLRGAGAGFVSAFAAFV